MSNLATSRDPNDHVAAANDHERVAVGLLSSSEDWAAVPFFYAAYRLIRATLISEPLFQQGLARLMSVNPLLQIGDRFAEHHSGGMAGSRSLGVSELVTILYPRIDAHYKRLHNASLQVRYGQGLQTISRAAVESDFAAVKRARIEGSMH